MGWDGKPSFADGSSDTAAKPEFKTGRDYRSCPVQHLLRIYVGKTERTVRTTKSDNWFTPRHAFSRCELRYSRFSHEREYGSKCIGGASSETEYNSVSYGRLIFASFVFASAPIHVSMGMHQKRCAATPGSVTVATFRASTDDPVLLRRHSYSYPTCTVDLEAHRQLRQPLPRWQVTEMINLMRHSCSLAKRSRPAGFGTA